MADWIGGYAGSFARKMQVAGRIAVTGLPLTPNAMVHGQNIDSLPEMIDLAERYGACRIDVATAQFHGWAELNRGMLMPTEQQARDRRAVVDAARQWLRGRMLIDYTPADRHATFFKACMGCWGSTGLNITPENLVLTCHAAQTIPHLTFQNVRGASRPRSACAAPSSTPIAEPDGWRNPAPPARARRSISAVAATRRRRGRVMRVPPTRSAAAVRAAPR